MLWGSSTLAIERRCGSRRTGDTPLTVRKLLHMIFLFLTGVAFFVALAVIATVIYWETWDARPVSYNLRAYPQLVSQPVTSWNDAAEHAVTRVQAGKTLYRYVEYCITRQTESSVREHWENGVIFQLPIKTGVGKPGCFKRTFSVRIPSELAGNDVKFIVRGIYEPNPLVTQVVELPVYTLHIEK
jgi:hypothetical protein